MKALLWCAVFFVSAAAVAQEREGPCPMLQFECLTTREVEHTGPHLENGSVIVAGGFTIGNDPPNALTGFSTSGSSTILSFVNYKSPNDLNLGGYNTALGPVILPLPCQAPIVSALTGAPVTCSGAATSTDGPTTSTNTASADLSDFGGTLSFLDPTLVAMIVTTSSGGVTATGGTTPPSQVTTTYNLAPGTNKFTQALFDYGLVFGTTLDPISTATGAVFAGPSIDLSLGGPLPLFLRRSYNSRLAAVFGSSPAGTNWTTNFDPYISISGNLAVVALEGGGSVSFQLNAGVYSTVYAPRMAFQLVKTSTNYRFLHPQNNLIYDFNTSGQLVKIEDRNGNAITVAQGPAGPAQASDGLGRSLTFTYGISGASMVLTSVQDQTGRTASYTYDNTGNLTGITDPNGNTTTYSYSSSIFAASLMAAAKLPRGNTPYTQAFDPTTGSATVQTDSEGNKTNLSYVTGGKPGVTVMTDPLGHSTTFNYGDPTLQNLTSVVDAAGNTTADAYDSLERPISFTDRLGNKTSVTYDPASGYLASSTDAQGNTTTFTYQAQIEGSFTYYNLAKIGYADGTSESFTYDGSGNALTATDRAGKTTTYTYNPLGQVLTAANPAGGVTTLVYNADATLATAKDPAGNLTTYFYDTLKRLVKSQFADNTVRSLTLDATDKILSVTDERNKATLLAYDVNNNLQSVTDALSRVATVSYDTDDLASSSTDRVGNKTSYQYDPLGSATAITDAAGEKTTFTYDNLERVQSAIDPAGKATAFGYDAEGRLTSVTDAVGNTGNIQVDKDGRPVQFTSPLSESTTVAYDSLSRVTGVTDALGRQSSFIYEPRGLPETISAPGGIATTLAWGALPLLSSVTDPNGNLWPITRDTFGRVTASTDPLGHAIKVTYDPRNRVASLTSPIDSVQFTRDADGDLTQAQYSDGVTQTFAYDNDDRLISGTGFSFALDANGRVTGSNGLTITRDAVGRISSVTYEPGKTVTYAYDPRGLLASVTDWAGGSVAFTFDAAHRLVSMVRSNGVVTTYTYDKDSQLASIAEASGTAPIASIALTRDAIGRVTSSARVIPQEAAPSAATSISNFDAANQIAGATYDARGRLTNDNAGSTYTWSAASRLVSYARPDGSASAAYDALGQRISRTVNGATQNYALDYATGLPTVAIIQSGGSDLTYYVYTPGGLLLYSIDAASSTHRFYSFDETGSTTMLTNDADTITDSYGISPYGDVVTAGPGNSTNNPFTWQGQLGVMQEPASKLYYARFRYYDSATARFLSRDPLFSPAPREVNPYQYAAGNPVANGDPMGLKPRSIFSTLDGLLSAWNSNETHFLLRVANGETTEIYDHVANAMTAVSRTALGGAPAEEPITPGLNELWTSQGGLGPTPVTQTPAAPTMAAASPAVGTEEARLGPAYNYPLCRPFLNEFGEGDLGQYLDDRPRWVDCLYFPPQPGGQK